MNAPALGGALAGGLIVAGALLFIVRMPWLRRITVADRIGPYLAEAPTASRLLVPSSRPRTASGPVRVSRLIGRWLDQRLGGSESVARRLERAGREPDPVGFRAGQVVAAVGSGAAALVIAGALWVVRGASPVALLVLVACAAGGGGVAVDWWLNHRIRQREALVALELPTVAELLVLSVTAGEGIAAALDRLARTSQGVLSEELGLVIADAHAGRPLTQALDDLGRRVCLPAVSRFVDGLVIALERGTPLADVLRAQAADAREAGRHAVIAEGGKREIRMMVPVVFLILPVTVLFAVFPGLVMLRLDL